MSKRGVEILLASRMAEGAGRKKGAMQGVATVAVAVSMAVMIVAMAVVGGFERALVEKMTGMTGHITVERFVSGFDADQNPPLVRNEEFERRGKGWK